MPYDSIEAAKKAGFPTSAEEIDLTLPQINKLAEIYDAIKKVGTAKEPFAVAWTAWKEIYKKEGDKWVEIKKKETAENFENSKWIPVAKANQTKQLGNGGKVILTEEALKRSIDSWKSGNILINHTESIGDLKILDAKYEAPFLYMQFDANTEKLFRNTDATGWSVQFDPKTLQFDGDKIIDGVGVGISILYPPHIPTCTPEMGCNETYAFEMYNDFEGKVISAKNESEFKALMDKLWGFFKNLTTVNKKEVKREVENQERNNLEKEEMDEKEKAELTSKLETATTALASMTSKFETATTAHDDEVKGMKKKIAEFEQKEADKTKAEKNAQFEQIVAKLPPGMTHKEEDKTALRAKFDSDPTKLMVELMAMERREGTGEEGDEFGTTPDEAQQIIEAAHKEAGIGFEVN